MHVSKAGVGLCGGMDVGVGLGMVFGGGWTEKEMGVQKTPRLLPRLSLTVFGEVGDVVRPGGRHCFFFYFSVFPFEPVPSCARRWRRPQPSPPSPFYDVGSVRRWLSEGLLKFILNKYTFKNECNGAV